MNAEAWWTTAEASQRPRRHLFRRRPAKTRQALRIQLARIHPSEPGLYSPLGTTPSPVEWLLCRADFVPTETSSVSVTELPERTPIVQAPAPLEAPATLGLPGRGGDTRADRAVTRRSSPRAACRSPRFPPSRSRDNHRLGGHALCPSSSKGSRPLSIATDSCLPTTWVSERRSKRRPRSGSCACNARFKRCCSSYLRASTSNGAANSANGRPSCG